MAQVDVRGSILYMPGPWGMARPAAGVSLAIVDRDVGNPDDTIFTATTNASGEFAGTTRDWRDTRSVTVHTPTGSYTSSGADPTDLMTLRLEVRQRIGNRNHSVSLPYAPPAPGLPSPRVVLPWGPPGRTQVRINGAVKRSLNDCTQALQSIFGAGAVAGATHEIVILGDGVAQLRQQLSAADGAIQGLLAAINTQLVRERRQGGGSPFGRPAGSPGTRTTVAVQGVRMGTSIPGPALPANDPWEAIRQKILAFVRTMEQMADAAVTQCASNGQVRQLLAKIVPVIVKAFIAAASATFILGSIATGGAGIAVASIVLAVVTVIASLPAILNALAAVLDTVGAHDAANLFRSAAGCTSTSLVDTEWFGSFVILVCMACAVFMLLLTSPADGWAWIVETVGGADGILGLRFVFSR